MSKLEVVNLGLTDYKSTWDLQRKLFELQVTGKISDVVLLNEHHHVYTLGKSSDNNHLLATEDELKSNGAEVFHIDRGGDITYHGPGQLVGYPILNLNNYYLDIHRYLRDLEEVIIRTLSEFGIQSHRDEKFTGVWVGSDKIAAIGVKVSRWVTMHGFALNVNTDLSYFDRIIPCGIFHKGVTSLHRLLGKPVSMDEVRRAVGYNVGEVFGVRVVERSADDFFRSLHHLETENAECLQAVNQ
jgi:lipoyl(octanoyl) transferase